MKTKFLIALFVSIFFFEGRNNVLLAQTAQPTMSQKHWTRADSAAINALIMYPDSIRINIFEACEYPALIVRIATEQKNTSAGFDSLVKSYSQNEQQDIWDLTRYPGLVQALVQGGQKSQDQINSILVNYPAEAHDLAVKYGTNYFNVLQSIDQLQAQTDQDFTQMLAEYSPVTQQAFRQLIQLPEVLNLLNDNLDITVLVGDHYKKNPQKVIRKTDSLNLVFARQHAQEVQQWNDSIQQNPQAASDLQAAANDYAQQNGYSQDDVNPPVDPGYVDNYSVYPYPYWFGYPTWYPYSYWYPYPYWYDCGFYRNRHGDMVFIGLPSYNFTNWYFYHPENWHRYPHLGNQYVSHYYGHRGPVSSNTLIVHKWVHDNRPYLPQDFITNKSNRVEAIKQIGQLNIDARGSKTGRVATVQQKNQYLQANGSKYSALNKTPQQPKMQEPNVNRLRLPDAIPPPVKQPAVRVQKAIQEQNTPQKTYKAPAPVYNYNNISRSEDYHKNSWQQSQPAPRPQQTAPRYQPAPQPHYSAPAPAPRQQAPSGGRPR